MSSETLEEVTSECFIALNQLQELDGPIGSPELIHQRVCGFIEGVKQRGRAAGIPDRDIQDALYALVALTDEIALSKPEPLRGLWITRPLQLQYFNENLAGEGFFSRLELLRKDRRRVDVLRIYYLCLLFGFQGRFAIRGGEMELIRIIDAVRTDVEAGTEMPDELSPNGDPPDEPLVQRNGRNPFLYLSLAIFAVAITVFVGLRLTLDSRAAKLVDRVEELTR
jgi:type VI secretion system protein ImpK